MVGQILRGPCKPHKVNTPYKGVLTSTWVIILRTGIICHVDMEIHVRVLVLWLGGCGEGFQIFITEEPVLILPCLFFHNSPSEPA